MATSGVVGGSSIDVNSLVSQLVAAERKPLDDQLARAVSKNTLQISATSALLGALSTFQGALNGLKTTNVFSGRSTTSTDADIVTATATATAAPGRYDIEVEQLASSQQISSTAFAGGATTVVGSGTLTISLGATSFSVGIADPANTLADIRNAINSSTSNPGVSASIINAADGAHLVLTSTKTGAANAIQVTQAGTLSALEYTTTNTANYTQLRAAQDALVNVAGYATTSETNTLTGVIDGVTLNLASAEPGTTVGIEVGYDKSAAKDKIKSFVTAYNTLRGMMTRLGGYDSASQTGGPMLGDSILTGVDTEIRRTLSSPVAEAGAAVQTLASIGITSSAKDGTLSIDDTKLDAALSSDFDGVARLFGNAETGVAAKLYSQITDRLANGAAIDTRNKALQAEQKALTKKKDDIDLRMQIVQQTYLKQFTRLDTLLSSLSSTSAYLSQQIDSLPSWSPN
ncbi:flagellar filament capping protein FliD [Peristeroidobacter soli]|uniref:flagellar filament capping protein FliD n=1 Tax=Peristeroidobacter soli TaxID=2497877 RepID=UPI00101CA0FC|nr:flagellar filament capping protein FliD [Peristeroidobacter soli]